MYRKIEPCAPTNYVICAVALQGLRWMTSCSFLPSSSPDCSCWNAVAAIKEEVMRTHPWNYLGLLFMTIMQTCWVSYICAWVPWETCAYALCGTLGIVLLLILFACQTKYDFTGAGPYILVAICSVSMFGMMAIIFQSKVLWWCYASIVLIALLMTIVATTQHIVGGKHKKYAFSPEDWVVATLCLYTDIVQVFITLLMMINQGSRED
eukprot:GHVU01134262.1.p1 GENE.GHVU01134262.1~~GHVU01134262.1.p1  ORF type:complete len:208 (+),score=12.13 GHVU01134262.1:739-1362(+)